MKTQNTDRQKLQALLGRYYAGETTPAEESEIRRLLHTEAGSDAAFDDDRRLFDALDGLDDVPADAEAPADLGEQLQRMVSHGYERRERVRVPVWLRWTVAGAAAACLAGAVIFSGNGNRADNNVLADNGAVTDTSLSLTPSEIPEAVRPAPVDPVKDIAQAAVPSRPVRKKHRRHVTRTVCASSYKSDNSGTGQPRAELTPGEAAEVTREALMTLGRALGKGNSLIDEAGDEIHDCVSRTLRKISQVDDIPEAEI